MKVGLEIGSVVAGKFRIERILADGGMSLVAAATHLQLEQTVALKFFRGDALATGESHLRFMREARAAAQLKSEHVARVLDVGVTEDGAPYMVMEHLEGRGLERVIADERSLDPSSACEYAIQACEALSEAHARGIIHRDIKPSNLFLAERAPGWCSIKVLDFGVSKVLLAQASDITTDLNVVMGTPSYMSPEQLQSAATVDHRTDLWSLGATLYQMLTGVAPFDPALPILVLAEAIASQEIPTVHALRPDVPKALSDVVARCLTRDREQRMGSAADLAAALVPFAPVRAHIVAERAATFASVFSASLGAGGDTALPARSQPEVGDFEMPVFVEIDPANRISPPGPLPNPITLPSPTAPPRAIRWPEVDGGAPPPATTSPTIESPPSDRDSPGIEGWLSPKGLAVLATGSILLCVFSFLILPRLVHRPGTVVGPATVAETAAPGESSELMVYVSPPSALVVIDGRLVDGNPFRGQFPRGETHVVEAIAPGYRTRVEQARMTSDVVINLSLEESQGASSRRPLRREQRSRAPVVGFSRVSERRAAQGAAPSTGLLVDPRGGRETLRPIVTLNPYAP
jgi:serine/threonine-protein kinase